MKNIWNKLPIPILLLLLAIGCGTSKEIDVEILSWQRTIYTVSVDFKVTNDSIEQYEDYLIDINFHVKCDNGEVINGWVTNIDVPPIGESYTYEYYEAFVIPVPEQKKVIDVTCDWDLTWDREIGMARACLAIAGLSTY